MFRRSDDCILINNINKEAYYVYIIVFILNLNNKKWREIIHY